MTMAIHTNALTKDYGGGRGLFDLQLAVNEGEVFGYLGPNGAGKSTTIRLLMGLIHPSAGSATIFDVDAQRSSVEAKRLIGYMPGELPLFGALRGRDIVGHFAGLRGGVDQKWVEELAERMDLDLALRFREYSSGNKRKLAIVLAFMHRPRLLILDEPTNGLDPLKQQEFYRLVRETKEDGRTVFLSSHLLSEVEHACDRVGIIRRGRLVNVSKLEELHEIHVREVEVGFAQQAEAQLFHGLPGVEHVLAQGHRVTFTVRGSFEPVADVLAGHHVVNLSSREPSLEEMFLSYYDEAPSAQEVAS